MRKITLLMAAMGLAVAPGLLAAPAQATSLAHTWVASNGHDYDNCDRPTPCATFDTAYTNTLAGGEITCVDSGNYGQLSIAKSITINCEAAIGSTTFAGGGIPSIVSMVTAATDIVVLRGLDIDGLGASGADFGMINFAGAGTLHVHNVKINHNGNNGITFNPTGPAKLFVSDSTITDMGNSGISGGIVIKPAAGIKADVSIERTRINHNFFGIVADGTAGGIIHGVVSDSVVAGNVNFGITASSAGASVVLLVESTKIASNSYGLVAGAVLAVGKSSIMFNGTGLYSATGGAIGSFKNNNLGVNGIDGTFSGVAAQQ